MKYRRVGTDLIYDVKNESLIPLYEGSEAYVKVEDEPVKTEKKAVEKKTAKK